MIRRLLPFWAWGLIALGFALVALGISIGFTLITVHSAVSNECGALKYLLSDHHLHPGAFRTAVQVWAERDGCG